MEILTLLSVSIKVSELVLESVYRFILLHLNINILI